MDLKMQTLHSEQIEECCSGACLNLVIVSITLLSLLYLVFSGIPEVKAENFKTFAYLFLR